MPALSVAGAQVRLLGAVKGLVSEGPRVVEAIETLRPDVIALTISPEELTALRAFQGEGAEPANYEEEVYMEGLGRFGDVEKPPPCFVAALEAGEREGIPVVAVDMDDETYTDAYVSRVSTLEIIGASFREKRLRRRRFAAETPEAFALEFDEVVNRPDGFRKLQEDREAHVGHAIERLARDHGSLLVVIDYERTDGVQSRLERAEAQ